MSLPDLARVLDLQLQGRVSQRRRTITTPTYPETGGELKPGPGLIPDDRERFFLSMVLREKRRGVEMRDARDVAAVLAMLRQLEARPLTHTFLQVLKHPVRMNKPSDSTRYRGDLVLMLRELGALLEVGDVRVHGDVLDVMLSVAKQETPASSGAQLLSEAGSSQRLLQLLSKDTDKQLPLRHKTVLVLRAVLNVAGPVNDDVLLAPSLVNLLRIACSCEDRTALVAGDILMQIIHKSPRKSCVELCGVDALSIVHTGLTATVGGAWSSRVHRLMRNCLAVITFTLLTYAGEEAEPQLHNTGLAQSLVGLAIQNTEQRSGDDLEFTLLMFDILGAVSGLSSAKGILHQQSAVHSLMSYLSPLQEWAPARDAKHCGSHKMWQLIQVKAIQALAELASVDTQAFLASHGVVQFINLLQETIDALISGADVGYHHAMLRNCLYLGFKVLTVAKEAEVRKEFGELRYSDVLFYVFVLVESEVGEDMGEELSRELNTFIFLSLSVMCQDLADAEALESVLTNFRIGDVITAPDRGSVQQAALVLIRTLTASVDKCDASGRLFPILLEQEPRKEAGVSGNLISSLLDLLTRPTHLSPAAILSVILDLVRSSAQATVVRMLCEWRAEADPRRGILRLLLEQWERSKLEASSQEQLLQTTDAGPLAFLADSRLGILTLVTFIHDHHRPWDVKTLTCHEYGVFLDVTSFVPVKCLKLLEGVRRRWKAQHGAIPRECRPLFHNLQKQRGAIARRMAADMEVFQAGVEEREEAERVQEEVFYYRLINSDICGRLDAERVLVNTARTSSPEVLALARRCQVQGLSRIPQRVTSTSQLTTPHLTIPRLTTTHPTTPHLTTPHITTPHLTTPHLPPISLPHTVDLPHKNTVMCGAKSHPPQNPTLVQYHTLTHSTTH